MAEMTFNDLRMGMFERYNAGKYQEALDFIAPYLKAFPEEEPSLRNWQFCLQGRCGQSQDALRSIEQALDDGFWWQPEALTQDPDLAALQDLPEFKPLVERAAQMYAAARQNSHPERLVILPAGTATRPYPTLIALHGMGGNAAGIAAYYRDLAQQGWLVAALQSSQISNPGGYVWDDHDVAVQEITEHYAGLCAEYPIDPQRVVLAGFSQGGGLAIQLAFEQVLPACGFLSVAGWLPDAAVLDTRPARPLRGALFTGGLDVNNLDVAQAIEKALQQHAVPYRLFHHDDIAHDYPAAFIAERDEALSFLLKDEGN